MLEDPVAVTSLLLGILNAVLAWLVWRARPRAAASVVLTWLFGLNAAQASLFALGSPQQETLLGLALFSNIATFVPLAVLPFVFPSPRVPPRARLAIAALVALFLAPVMLDALSVAVGRRITFFADIPLLALAGAAIVSIGALLLLDAYLGASGQAQREQARYGLAAFGLKLGAALGASSILPWVAPVGPYPDAVPAGFDSPQALTLLVAALVWHATLFAIPIAILVARIRKRDTSALGGDALVLGAIVGMALVTTLVGFAAVEVFEYLLFRPLLLAYGMLRLQILPVALPRQRGFLAAGLVAAVGATYLFAFGAAAPRVDAPLAQATALLAALVVGGLLLAAFATSVRGMWPGGANPHRLEIYRSILAARDGSSTQSSDLRAVRGALGITDREHALLESALSADVPRAGAALTPGNLVLGRFLIERRLGGGGYGETFLARDTVVERDVVVKTLRARDDDGRALREARALGKVSHPSVVTLYDVEQLGATVYIVMEHVPGGSLAQRIEREGRVEGEAFRVLAAGVLDGLGAIHAAGLVHRDVKPGNILLAARGEAKLADFGIAEMPGIEATVSGMREGHAVGTVRFMSPEQARGRRATPASDVFSAGATLYEAWTGKPYIAPLPNETAAELQIRAAFAEAFDKPVEPPALRAWFARCLAPAAEERFATAGEAREALEPVWSSITASPRGP